MAVGPPSQRDPSNTTNQQAAATRAIRVDASGAAEGDDQGDVGGDR